MLGIFKDGMLKVNLYRCRYSLVKYYDTRVLIDASTAIPFCVLQTIVNKCIGDLNFFFTSIDYLTEPLAFKTIILYNGHMDELYRIHV